MSAATSCSAMKHYAYIDGTCEIRLPAGPIDVEIHKGPEYTPQSCCTSTLAPGKAGAAVRHRALDGPAPRGWYSGDTALSLSVASRGLARSRGGGSGRREPARRRSQSPGRSPHGVSAAVPNLLAFSGQRPALEIVGTLVVVNTLNAHPVLGQSRSAQLSSARLPAAFRRAGRARRLDLGGLVRSVPSQGRPRRLGGPRGRTKGAGFRYGEPLADLILGKVDVFEVDAFEDSPFDVVPGLVRLLNIGLRVPLAGGSGKDNNGMVLGSMRTYARLSGQEFTYKNWIEAIRAGRTFVTNGPLLSFTVDGQEPGGAATVLPAGRPLRIRAEAARRSLRPTGSDCRRQSRRGDGGKRFTGFGRSGNRFARSGFVLVGRPLPRGTSTTAPAGQSEGVRTHFPGLRPARRTTVPTGGRRDPSFPCRPGRDAPMGRRRSPL